MKTFDLIASCQISAATDGDSPDPPGSSSEHRRFEMTAYTGGPMALAGWRFPVVVDLAGLEVGDQSRAILLAHNPDVDDVVGQSDRIEIVEGNLIAAGNVLGDSPRVQRMLALADKGFNWQASIGARAEQVEFIKAGKTVTVNGSPFTGPINVARRSALGEISFVTRGADDQTSARIAANATNTKDTDMDFDQWLEARGFNADDLDEPQRQSLQAMYDNDPGTPGPPGAPGSTSGSLQPGQGDPNDAGTATDVDRSDPVAQMRASAADELKRQNRITEICGTDQREIAANAIAQG